MKKLFERIGRQLQRWWDDLRGKNDDEPVHDDDQGNPPVQQPPSGSTPNANRPEDYRVGGLWKPIGDDDRPAVFLVPPAFTHKTDKLMVMSSFS